MSEVKEEAIAIYVLEGGEDIEGWHNFKTYGEAVEYCQKLIEADIDFVFNPNW